MSEERERGPCVVCGGWSDGRYGRDGGNHPSAVDVCMTCFEEGKLREAWESAQAEIEELGRKYGMMPWDESQSIFWHLHQYRASAKHSINMEDGVCPNGCARLEMVDGDPHVAHCNVCDFTGFSNVPHPFFAKEPPIESGFDSVDSI